MLLYCPPSLLFSNFLFLLILKQFYLGVFQTLFILKGMCHTVFGTEIFFPPPGIFTVVPLSVCKVLSSFVLAV